MNDDAVSRWLAVSDDELGMAQDFEATARVRGVCYHSQQAIEKAVKAALIFESIEFPHTHDLEKLCNLLPAGWSVKNTPYDLGRISD